MTQMPLGKLFLLTIVTFGIYMLVWLVRTKDEMNALGAEVPTGWLLIVPIANVYFMWKYAQGVEHVTKGETPTMTAFLMILLLGFFGTLIVQSKFNGLGASSPQPALAG